MSMTIIIAGAGAALALAAAGVVWRRMRPIKSERFQDRWQEVQKLCSAKESWPKAVVDADRLLDEALKKRHIAGKNMGERLVRAQRLFTDNDSVWFGHKLRSKVEGDPETKLKEDEVKNALIGIRQALKDLGALPK